MFTGIVQEIGVVEALRRRRGADELVVHAPRTAAVVVPTESVAVNGVCLSVVRRHDGQLLFEVIPETHHRTALGTLKAGARVNVERSLALSDRLSGHLVLGHVDGTGRIARRQERSGQVVLTVQIPRTLRRFLVPKGPVTVDGVSLTVGAWLSPTTFSVFLIPETWHRTTLASREVGDPINIEVDYFAKLIAQLLMRRVNTSH